VLASSAPSVFDSKKLDYREKIYGDLDWNSIPTCKSEGLNVEYLDVARLFHAARVSKDVVAYYVNLLKKVRETPEWKKLMSDGAFNQTFMIGDQYAKWAADTQRSCMGA
jgi:tripartite-type tricarboxylate transporter receptor subunit TctC